MADPIGSVSGLASGVQWRDMVDQIMQLESQRTLDPLTARVTAQQNAVSAWNSYQSAVQAFGTAAGKLADGSAFGRATVNVGASLASGRALLSATATATADPGSYKVEVMSLARAEKLSGGVMPSATAVLHLSGDFLINGRRVTVGDSDTLASIRDKINAVNSGASPSGATATILSAGTADARLILTSDRAGSAGIELVDGTTGVLGSLGLLDGTPSTVNRTATGAAQSNSFTSVTMSIATMLGVTMPPPSTIKVGDKTITVDLSLDSLSSIAARIQAAGGSARTVSETSGGTTSYRLVVDDAVSPNPADAANSRRTLELLGLYRAGRGAIAQVVQSAQTLTDGTGATATTATALTALHNGTAGGVAAGDKITIAGTRGDGSAVNLSYTVTGTDTVQTLLDKLNDATSGFGAGTRRASATFVGGKIVLTDGTSGDSQLALSLSTDAAGGGSFGFGPLTTTTVGRQRELVDGSDAQLRVDGVQITRNSNTITDAIAGVTLNLTQTEMGSPVDVTVARDTSGMMADIQAFATAYNNMLDTAKQQMASGGPLAANGAERASVESMKSVLLTDVAGLSGTSFTRGAIAGVALDKEGHLTVDTATLSGALSTNFAEVRSLFSTTGTTTDGEVQYLGPTDKTKPGTYAVNITAPATTAAAAGVGFSGTYADDGTPDKMTVSDVGSGASGSIQLTNGDDTDAIVRKLNALFGNGGMRLTAANIGGQVKIASLDYGSSTKFTISYAGGGTDGSAQLGLAAGTYAGTDVSGTIGGVAAKGSGQVLTGATGAATEGLAIRYTGATARSAGSVTFVLGVGGTIARVAAGISRPTDGTVASQVDTLNRSVDALNTRVADVQQRLDAHRQALIAQFTAMEQAISKIQAQGSLLTNQLSQLNGVQSSAK